MMNSQVILFLEQLRANNNRVWFGAHKESYEEAKATVESFTGNIIGGIAAFDPTVRFVAAKDCLFRIFRDVRFSKNKEPYKTNMGAWITASGRKSPGPGYYIHIEPGSSFLAAGVYMPMPDQLKKIRQEIYYNIAEFKSILKSKTAKRYFDGISEMDMQKLPPRDFPKDFPDINLLKHKHYTVSHPIKDEEIRSREFQSKVLEVFKAMHPLNEFLRRALLE